VPLINGDDATLSFSKLKILFAESCHTTSQSTDNVKIINRNVDVTMHQYKSFEKIQQCSNLSLQLFRESLHPNYNRSRIFQAGEGAGRSGSFFFFSHDSRFIIKTMTSEELKLIKSILPQYVQHF